MANTRLAVTGLGALVAKICVHSTLNHGKFRTLGQHGLGSVDPSRRAQTVVGSCNGEFLCREACASMAATVLPSEWPPTTHRSAGGPSARAVSNAPVARKAIPSGC